MERLTPAAVEEFTRLRRDIHRHPELAFDEHRTSSLVAAQLASWGYAVTTGLGVADGIETALSLAWGHAPVWALIDAGHLAKFPPLAGIESLVIACDNDPAGIAAARACSARWAERGVEVFVTRQEANDLGRVNTNSDCVHCGGYSGAWRSRPSNSPRLSTACPSSVATSA